MPFCQKWLLFGFSYTVNLAQSLTFLVSFPFLFPLLSHIAHTGCLNSFLLPLHGNGQNSCSSLLRLFPWCPDQSTATDSRAVLISLQPGSTAPCLLHENGSHREHRVCPSLLQDPAWQNTHRC